MLFIPLLFVLLTFGNCDSELVEIFDNVILHQKQVKNYVASSPLDPLNNKMKTFGGGLYTQAQVDALKQEALDHVYQRFGFNFSQGVPTVYEGYALPIGTFHPICTGDDGKTRWSFESERSKIGKSGSWITVKFGFMVFLNSTGVFPGGVMAGRTFVPNNVIGYTDNNYFDLEHQDQWNKTNSKSRRIIKVWSDEVSYQVTNNEGLTETVGKETWKDEKDRYGFATIITVQRREFDGSVTYNVNTVATFGDITFDPVPPLY